MDDAGRLECFLLCPCCEKRIVFEAISSLSLFANAEIFPTDLEGNSATFTPPSETPPSHPRLFLGEAEIFQLAVRWRGFKEERPVRWNSYLPAFCLNAEVTF